MTTTNKLPCFNIVLVTSNSKFFGNWRTTEENNAQTHTHTPFDPSVNSVDWQFVLSCFFLCVLKFFFLVPFSLCRNKNQVHHYRHTLSVSNIGPIKRPTNRLRLHAFLRLKICVLRRKPNSLSEENKCESWNVKKREREIKKDTTAPYVSFSGSVKQQVEIVEIAAAEFGVGVSNRLSSQCMSILIIFFFRFVYRIGVFWLSIYARHPTRDNQERSIYPCICRLSHVLCVPQ